MPYGSAFEGEVVRKNDMRVEFGGKKSRAFEYLRMADLDQVEDGKIEIVGPGFETAEDQGAMDLGILVEVAGRKMQKDFEPVLERQIHYFVNGASGIQHIGQRDITWIRISKNAVGQGLQPEALRRDPARPLPRRLRQHRRQGAGHDRHRPGAAHGVAGEGPRWPTTSATSASARMTDESVDEFYSCTLCQSFAPNHVCIVSPERLGLCGAYNWLDCKASYQINPTGPNQPIKKAATDRRRPRATTPA